MANYARHISCHFSLLLPFPFPGVLPDSEIESLSPALQADSLPSEPPGKPLFKESNYFL